MGSDIKINFGKIGCDDIGIELARLWYNSELL
jgi:hypothetical protein